MIKQASGLAGGQPASQKVNARLQSLSGAARHAPDYTLGPGDVVLVTVIGVPTLDKKEFALDSDGKISLPYVGEVRLLGKSARDAEAQIAALFEVSLVVDPEVSVSIKTYKSQYCYVFGAVVKPGATQMTGATYLLDALTMAGGLQEKAGTRIQIHRSLTDPRPSRTRRRQVPRRRRRRQEMRTRHRRLRSI